LLVHLLRKILAMTAPSQDSLADIIPAPRRRDHPPVPDGAVAFDQLKHNWLVAPLARCALKLLNLRLQKVIFTATTGRSGTKALARFFSSVPGCTALHEPYPEMCGPVLRAATYGNSDLADKAYWHVKSINILRAAFGSRYYIESNHCFIKSFSRQAMDDFGNRVAVIHLVRPAIDVATSIYRLQHHPGTAIGNTWWLDYRAPSNLIALARLLDSDSEFSHPFYKALWYWHEIEMRIAAWSAQRPSRRLVRFETNWLGNKQRLLQLLDQLEIEYDPARIVAISGQAENARAAQKVVAALPAAQAQEMLCRFRKLLARRDIDISVIGVGA
jgi:hypothetical protein